MAAKETLSDWARKNFNRTIKRPMGSKRYVVKGIASTGRATSVIAERTDDGWCITFSSKEIDTMIFADD
jgi:hypothetical protein